MRTIHQSLVCKLFCFLITGATVAASNLEEVYEGISAPVRFYGYFVATNVGTVSLNGVSSSETNALSEYICGDSDGLFATPLTLVSLEIYKTYTLTIAASHAYHMEAHLLEPTVRDLVLGRDKDAQQYSRYRLYIRKVESGVTNEWELLCASTLPSWSTEADSDGDCHPVTLTYEVQLRPDLGARPVQLPGTQAHDDSEPFDDWNQNGAAINATSAPGDEIPLALTGGKGNNSSNIDIEWGVRLGRLWSGRSAGNIRIVENGIDNATLTPSVLQHTPRSMDTNEVEILVSGNPSALRQIKTPQTFVDIATISTNSFQINFYTRDMMGPKDGNGFYTVSTNATNFASYRIDSSGALSNRLAIHEIRNCQTSASILDYNASSNLWTLTRGTGNDARILTRQISFQSNLVNRIEVEEIKNGAGAISSKSAEVWKTEGFTRELVRVTNALGTLNLVTVTNYITISNVNYISQIEYPDGY